MIVPSLDGIYEEDMYRAGQQKLKSGSPLFSTTTISFLEVLDIQYGGPQIGREWGGGGNTRWQL